MVLPLALSSRTKRRIDLKAAFTLIEILIALAILGMLVAVSVSKLTNILGGASRNVASMFVNQELKTPLTTYRIDMGDYPTTDQGLGALYVAPANAADRWHGPYAEGNSGKLPDDPWGHPYHYVYPGVHNKGGYDLWSSGPDGVDGNDDDIKNW
jgi:general secretion pathway protein G